MLKPSEAQPTVNAGASSRRIAVGYRAIAELKLDPANPRIHSKKQVRQIAASIAAFGFNVPILVDAQSKVVAGHGRILACLELGLTEVPTICLDHLGAARARAFLIADNRLTENASWDEQLLAQQLQDLCVAQLDFSIEATGFEMGEIDLLIENLSPAPAGEDDPADALPAPGGPAVTQAGDLWLLGSHRLLCGNALEQSCYAALMGERKAAMVFTDAPYNVPIAGHVSGKGAIEHREFAMACGEMSALEFTGFLTQVCQLLARHSVDGALHYHCMDWRRHPRSWRPVIASHRIEECVRVGRDKRRPGRPHTSQHELIFVGSTARPPTATTSSSVNSAAIAATWHYGGAPSAATARRKSARTPPHSQTGRAGGRCAARLFRAQTSCSIRSWAVAPA
jgi:hypothetical protein